MFYPTQKMLSKVLNQDVCNFYWLNTETKKDIVVEWNDDLGIMSDSFNIFELSNMFKEWATPLHSKYYLDIHVDGLSETTHKRKYCVDVMCMQTMNPLITFEADNEPEAVFLACEWIAEENDAE